MVIGLLPALTLIAGAVSTLAFDLHHDHATLLPLASCGFAVFARIRRWERLAVAALAFGYLCAGVALGASARERALRTSLRASLERECGGFLIDALGPGGEHAPVPTRAVILEDATTRDTFVSLRVRVVSLQHRGRWQPVEGNVLVSIGGQAALQPSAPASTPTRPGDDEAVPGSTEEWIAGRTIEAPMTFRRPIRFLNEGVPDFERDLALDGITLLASVKSGLLVEVVSRGGRVPEMAAAVRMHVRRAIGRWVRPYDAVSAAIATAVLIGDRGGLPDETRDLLQAAGTYHVIAISGGNIAVLAAIVSGLLAVWGVRGRRAAVPAIAILVLYALVATTGPSVWRATLMAILYFAARAIDHRIPTWQATAIAAALMVVVRPLDVRDAGFILTFGATAALLEGARRGSQLLPRHRVLSWVMASIASSLAVEMALLPVSAQMFSRVTSAGLMLNLLAVPMTAAIQIAGLVAVAFDRVEWMAAGAGWTVHLAVSALVGSAHLVTVAPWLSARIPAPGLTLIAIYYAALALTLLVPRLRIIGLLALLSITALIAGGGSLETLTSQPSGTPVLRVTMFDVGQGESLLLETPSRDAFLIDAGGTPFGGGVDIGQRVLAPALWSRGIRSLHTFVITHGDPDHIGGALAAIDDFLPARLVEGIRVPRHEPSLAIAEEASRHGITPTTLRAGQQVRIGDVRVVVLSPPEPDWERRRVRNDDSIVLEVIYRDVALLLTGDIGADVERALVPALIPAPTRILKVAHHGSRTSTSSELLNAWRPSVALISCGRGNRFGHPAMEVLDRLSAIGAAVFRTDRHGAITVETDGTTVRVQTYVGHGEHGEIGH
jgi:competence protein ComEC